MSYTIKYKRKWWLPWITTSKLMGHRYEKDMDRFVLFHENGSIQEISNWSKCDVLLGLDWVLATKADMEKQANTNINLAVKTTT